MGIFDSFKQANAESPGRVMMSQLRNAQQEMASMSERVRGQVVMDFREKRKSIISRLSNMTKEGILKTGKDFQVAGNKLRRTVPVEGYPLLLVGMWLESGYRPGMDAAAVHKFLDDIATEVGGFVSS